MQKKRKKILVVDDEPHIVELIKFTLQDKYEVMKAFTSVDALSLLEIHTPDLILLDVMMPGEDGFKLCERIRSNPEFSDIPIIFVSARHHMDDKMRSIDVGADDYITKPFDPAELERKVEATLIMQKIK